MGKATKPGVKPSRAEAAARAAAVLRGESVQMKVTAIPATPAVVVVKPMPIAPTPERISQSDGCFREEDAEIDRAGEKAVKTRRFTDRHIDRIHRRGLITYAQWYAADWYAEVYHLAGIGQRVVSRYGAASGVGETTYGMPVTVRQADARGRLRAAREHIVPHKLTMIEDVVLHDAMPCLKGGRQRERFARSIGRALQPLAEWINAPTTA